MMLGGNFIFCNKNNKGWMMIDIMEKLQGIYKITNITTGKTYIGRSTNVFKRWQQHLRHLIKGEHPCQNLQYEVDMALMDNTYFNIEDILRFEIIENIPDNSFKFRELEEIYNIPSDQRYNVLDMKDEILYYIGQWCKAQEFDFEIDYKHPDCKYKQPLNWNMRIDGGNFVVLIVLRMDNDNTEMSAKYQHMDEIRNSWISSIPDDSHRWILKTYDVWDNPLDIINELIADIERL